jgi:hypothetical protein
MAVTTCRKVYLRGVNSLCVRIWCEMEILSIPGETNKWVPCVLPFYDNLPTVKHACTFTRISQDTTMAASLNYCPSPSPCSSLSMSASLADLVVGDKKVKSKFECPMCNKILRDPIIVCSDGHNVCKLCILSEDEACPIESCASTPSNIPNVAMENVILELGLPISCRHTGTGFTK